jgi:hypothetical protein
MLSNTAQVEKGQYVGLANADGPMNLARITSGSDNPGFWYSNSAVAAGPTTISLDHWCVDLFSVCTVACATSLVL